MGYGVTEDDLFANSHSNNEIIWGNTCKVFPDKIKKKQMMQRPYLKLEIPMSWHFTIMT